MKAFNVILAVLIFLLAATSAIFSFFLFEKRKQLVDAHALMAEQFETSTQKIDKNNDLALQDVINQGKLAHNNSVNLPIVMKNFDILSDKITANRNDLAKTLVEIANVLEKNGYKENDFAKLDKDDTADKEKVQTQLANLLQHTKEVISRRDGVLDLVGQAASDLDIDAITSSDLKSAQYKSKFQPILNDIATKKARIRGLENDVKVLAANLEMSTPPLTDNYHGDIVKMQNQANKIVKDRDTNFKNWKNKEREAARHLQTIAAQTNTIKLKDKEIQKLKSDLYQLYIAVGEKNMKRMPIENGSRATLEMLKLQNTVRVLAINEKFGFITISLGTNTRVIERFGNKDIQRDPKIPQAHYNGSQLEMIIARNMPSGKAEYINRVKITKLDADCAIAEPCDKDGKEIAIGDIAYFSDKEIEKILKTRK